MAIRRPAKQTLLEFVDSLPVGTRVIWVANGSTGTVQPDQTIFWDQSGHMTRKQMAQQQALLVHSEEEKKQLRATLEARLKCLKSGCKLVHWDDDGYSDAHPERLCPIAVLTGPREPSRRRTARQRSSPQPTAA